MAGVGLVRPSSCENAKGDEYAHRQSRREDLGGFLEQLARDCCCAHPRQSRVWIQIQGQTATRNPEDWLTGAHRLTGTKDRANNLTYLR